MLYCHPYRRGIMPLIIFLAILFAPLSLRAEEASPQFSKASAEYKLPDVEVIRQDGKKLSFSKELNDGRPVILNFIFTSCSAICPMLIHTLSKTQSKLKNVHFVSISIDPENDTSAKLDEYRKKFDAGAPSLVDLAPTILSALGVAKGGAMEGSDLLS